MRVGDIMKITAYAEMGAIQYKINKSQTNNKRPNDTIQHRQILLRNESRQVNLRAAGSKKDNKNCKTNKLFTPTFKLLYLHSNNNFTNNMLRYLPECFTGIFQIHSMLNDRSKEDNINIAGLVC